MVKLSALLFELSSDERMRMLMDLCVDKARLSHIAQKQDITIAEASRHLQRLSEAELVSKNADGLYLPTSYGKLVLSLLSGLNFVTENKAYFLEHNLSVLPIEFVDRIGELGISSFRGDTISNLAYEENMFVQA